MRFLFLSFLRLQLLNVYAVPQQQLPFFLLLLILLRVLVLRSVSKLPRSASLSFFDLLLSFFHPLPPLML